jgi:CRISPR/Cas system-associated exonuclease Cas4 (RecB family)
MNTIEFTISDYKSYSWCPKQFDYSSPTRQNLTPKKQVVALAYGSIIHDCLESYYLGADDLTSIYTEMFNDAAKDIAFKDETECDELYKNGYYLLKEYPTWANLHLPFSVDDVVKTEERGTVRLNMRTPGIFFGFKYDLLVRYNNQNWLVDFKTTKRLPTKDADYLVYDDQAVGYQWAFEEVFEQPLAGVMFIYINKLPINTPKILKSGKVSTDKRIRTTPSLYAETCGENEFDLDYLQYLTDMLNGRFFIHHTSRANNKRKEEHRRRMLEFAYCILEDKLPAFPVNSEMRCKACAYFEPCQLEQMGLSNAKEIATNFEVKTPRD